MWVNIPRRESFATLGRLREDLNYLDDHILIIVLKRSETRRVALSARFSQEALHFFLDKRIPRFQILPH
ncbi:hypothetical protein PLCT1_00346 [Planctomycetaceae bacterium]|nr:hypothetical protein PLCT1_00346 [Planctomycetaceae bacterium]